MVNEIKITWQDYVEEHRNSDNSDFIFRGHSNSEEEKWKLTSTFGRYYNRNQYNFRKFLSQQLEENLFRNTYGNYEYVKNNNLCDSNLITKLYHLQHYGVPTCFIDFTHNPLIALYFALTGIKGQSGGAYDANSGMPKFYNHQSQITIFKINHSILNKVLGFKELSHTDNDLFLNYDTYAKRINEDEFGHVAIDLKPEQRISPKVDNYNLKNQQSAFIMYDQWNLDMDLERFICEFIVSHKLDIQEPIITKYYIEYNTLFSPAYFNESKPLFRYLKEQNIYGKVLFNDHQGLKYDFNFFHNK